MYDGRDGSGDDDGDDYDDDDLMFKTHHNIIRTL